MIDFEKLGAFYLGKTFDAGAGEVQEEVLLYDAKDLTTHAVCVGMTGSGKTGLCITLLEEAAIDGVPALIIDPKGDLGNLFLTFPNLKPEDFEPWVDPGEAARKGKSPAEYASWISKLWKNGIAEWGQDGKRIRRLRESAELALYTPGSTAGRPLRILRSFAAPSAAVLDDQEALRDRIQTSVSGLLSLLGVDADPIQSREHILLSNLLDRAWREGRDLALGSLIQEIQKPPFDKLGVLDLESFFPEKERFGLAMRLNNLLASPGFAAWMEGEPLDVGKLLYTSEGKPRLSVLSIGHLSDPERMFFVTLLLNEVTSWMRAQPGTSSLRALLYMDEVFGYFPPTANPPSKVPMLTLLKQARAYGLGIVLATQNPVDLDYKGLSNTGTWFLGRLQTERDKARVLDGLEGAATTSGATFDRAETERILSGLKSRVFLLNNVHEDHPVLFHTRWALSYLRGPLTRDQIRKLARPAAGTKASTKKTAKAGRRKKAKAAAAPAPAAARTPTDGASAEAEHARPTLDPKIAEVVLEATLPGKGRIVYRPALFGAAELHYTHARTETDEWTQVFCLASLDDDPAPDPWAEAQRLEVRPELGDEPLGGAAFGDLPAAASRARSYGSWEKRFKTALYRDHPLERWRCSKLRLWSEPDEDEGAFRARVQLAGREKRDLALEKLRNRYTPKLKRIQDRIQTQEQRVEREQEQHRHSKTSTIVSVGATVLGALFGRKTASMGNIGRAATAARSASRTSREKADIARAEEKLEELRDQLEDLEAKFEADREKTELTIDPEAYEVESLLVRPRKSDITIGRVALAWTPYYVSEQGIATPAFERPDEN